ncbi:hypothetical protein C8Q76DRAFT_698323 [Earliella scabrosa]|nr:hypothetical protein C8Q76DRAFT_698323 [Earliella scabrosa]
MVSNNPWEPPPRRVRICSPTPGAISPGNPVGEANHYLSSGLEAIPLFLACSPSSPDHARPLGEIAERSDSPDEREDTPSSELGPIGEWSSDGGITEEIVLAPDGAHRLDLPYDDASTPPAHPIGGPNSGDRSSSPIGPVGEGEYSDSDRSSSLEVIGQRRGGSSDSEAGLPFESEGEQRSFPSRTDPDARRSTSFATLNASGSPSPVQNPTFSPTPTASSLGARDDECETSDTALARLSRRLTTLDAELLALRRADGVLARSPESRISSRDPYWQMYNGIIGARGDMFEQMWYDNRPAMMAAVWNATRRESQSIEPSTTGRNLRGILLESATGALAVATTHFHATSTASHL